MTRTRALTALLVLIALSPDSLPAVELPAVAFSNVDVGVSVTDEDGALISSFGSLHGRYSLDGNILAGLKKHGNVTAHDATTKEELARIKSALSPVVLGGGNKVAFVGNFNRDEQVNSLWIRNLKTGRTRKVIQFANGASLPGVKTGFQGENALLEASFDEAVTTAAVVEGNDLSLFIYDVWSIDVPTGKATRLTSGKRSRHASVAPDGDRIALFRQDKNALCGGPPPGYRSGEIVVVDSDGTNKEVIAHGSCSDVFYDDPRWLDDDTLVARLSTHVEGQELRNSELVLIEVADGSVSPAFTSTKRVGSFSVSPSLGLIVFDDFVNGGVWVYEVGAGETLVSSDGFYPHLSGDHRTL